MLCVATIFSRSLGRRYNTMAKAKWDEPVARRRITSWDDVPIVMDLPLAGSILGRSPEYLKALAQKGEFPAYKEGDHWRISKAVLMKRVGDA
jgi:hypothetical protein